MRLLFVDDEPSIRATMPAILRREGFEVTVGATVEEGLDLIRSGTFDVLLTDLNIGNPGDGFVLVSAMRRLQPESNTFILTGFPDFETALEAIRKQVDDYFVKPADIPSLVKTIKDRIEHPRHLRDEPTKRVSEILRANRKRIVELWLAQTLTDKRIASLPLTTEQRVDCLGEVIEVLATAVDKNDYILTAGDAAAASLYGKSRAQQRYSVALLLKEASALANVLSAVVQENLLVADLSTLVPDVLRIGVSLNVVLETALEAFEEARKTNVA